jgi:hypothetical protein
MFGFFKKKKKEFPPFDYVENSSMKDKYFSRTLQWDFLNEEMIHVFDAKGPKPRMITMDPWPQTIYLDADGQKTVREYILSMADLYSPDPIPEHLDKEIIEVIEDLIKDGELVELKDTKTNLPYYLDLPISNQDKEKARQMMLEDGYIKEEN